jgi:hypothetical protein
MAGNQDRRADQAAHRAGAGAALGRPLPAAATAGHGRPGAGPAERPLGGRAGPGTAPAGAVPGPARRADRGQPARPERPVPRQLQHHGTQRPAHGGAAARLPGHRGQAAAGGTAGAGPAAGRPAQPALDTADGLCRARPQRRTDADHRGRRAGRDAARLLERRAGTQPHLDRPGQRRRLPAQTCRRCTASGAAARCSSTWTPGSTRTAAR